MTHALTLPMLGLIGFCIATEVARELCFKHGATDAPLRAVLMKKMIWLGIFFWTAELIAWICVLQYVPISIAFPIASLNYVITVIGAAWLLKETVTRRHALGALLITAGVACVGATGV